MTAAYHRALAAAKASALVSNYCDRVEHNEVVERDWVLDAGRVFRRLGFVMARELGALPFELYAERLEAIELRNALYAGDRLSDRLRLTSTWRQVQLLQVEHDRIFHPDVFGLSRSDQLRHYAFHAAKLAGALARDATDDIDPAELRKRIPDLLLFGVKLATVMSERLPDVDRTELL